jgi:glutaredoxin
MDIKEPLTKGFTIYSKSGCINCTKAKKLLEQKDINFLLVDCDEYLIEQKEVFLSFIKSKSNINCRMFPMIFVDDNFIGGYKELEEHLNRNLSFNENDFI